MKTGAPDGFRVPIPIVSAVMGREFVVFFISQIDCKTNLIKYNATYVQNYRHFTFDHIKNTINLGILI